MWSLFAGRSAEVVRPPLECRAVEGDTSGDSNSTAAVTRFAQTLDVSTATVR